MSDSATFLCECGTWLRIVTQDHGESILPCPNPSCGAQHTADGEILYVLTEKDGRWVRFDWKPSQHATGA